MLTRRPFFCPALLPSLPTTVLRRGCRALAALGLLCLWLLQATAWAGWSNGSFEQGTPGPPPPAPWISQPLLNQSGLDISPPTRQADLNLSSNGPQGAPILGVTKTVGSPIQDNFVAQALYPPWGQQALVLNFEGSNHSANRLTQTVTMGPADVDPDDGLVHIRMAIAPVLEQANHRPEQDPYVFIEVRNLSRGDSQLLHYFVAPQMTGVRWTTGTVNGKTFVYTPWQIIDLAPGVAQLAPGDEVTLSIVAAGCALGSHEGHVYVDGIGSLFPPGLSVQASAPAQVLSGASLSYELRYANTGSSTVPQVQLAADTPPNTTFVSLVPPPGASCTSPAVGASGLLNCTLSNPLARGQQGQWRMTVQLNPGVPAGLDTLSNSLLYTISAPSTSALRAAPPVIEVLDPAVHHTVTLSKSGDGAGSVGSSPQGLVCDAGCTATSTELNNGSQITLSASPDAASYFVGWSGDCSGQADCVLTMWGAPRQVGATFSSRPLATLSNAQINLTQGQAVTALRPVSGSAGSAPLSYAVAPALPAGLSLDPDSGSLSGTPTALAAARSYIVTVTDAHQYSASASFTLAVLAALQSQTLRFDSPPVLAVGGSARLGVSASSGLASSLSSLTPDTCSVSAGLLQGLAQGECQVLASQGGDARYAATQARSDPFPVTLRNASLQPVGSVLTGPVALGFSGGGNSATLTGARALAGPEAPAAPAGLNFAYGLIDFSIGNLDRGASVSVTLSFPQALPTGTRYWKYGHQSPGDVAHWHVFEAAVISGNTITLPLSDGGSGDDDGVVDGRISDPGGVVIGLDGTAVPTFTPWGLALLAVTLALATRARRRGRS